MSSEPPEVEFEFATPASARLLAAGGRFCLWVLIIGMGALLLLQTVIVPDWPPPRRFYLAFLAATPLAALLTLGWFLRRVHRIVVADCVEFHQPRKVRTAPREDVLGLVGLTGLNLDGGDLIAWKHIIVISTNHSFKLSFGQEATAACFRALSQLCPCAWKLPPRGSLEPPSQPGDANHTRAAIIQIESVYGTWFFRSLANGAAILAAGIVGVVALVVWPPPDKDFAQAMLWLIGIMITGVYLMGATAFGAKARGEIRQMKQKFQ